MSATVIQFPSETNCPCCGRACNEEDLSACYRCGDKFCGSAKSDCRSICACDRFAEYVADFLSYRQAEEGLSQYVPKRNGRLPARKSETTSEVRTEESEPSLLGRERSIDTHDKRR